MSPLPYNPDDKDSILLHARLLLGMSVNLLYDNAPHKKGKGGIGQSVEQLHFLYEPNSKASADFENAGVELKCTPLKTLNDGSLVSKERLVLNIINYMGEADKGFRTSSFWKKNRCLLLLMYLYEKDTDYNDFLFKIIRYWDFPATDLKIIEEDWNKIHGKIASGHAHELSEGDTFYLAACPKGTKAGAQMREQPNSSIRAQQRAYSLKSSYINTIILDSLDHPEMFSGIALTNKQRAKIAEAKSKCVAIVNDIADYNSHETFEQLIYRRFEPFLGKTISQICQELGVTTSESPKAVSRTLCCAILGIKSSGKIEIAEFVKGNVLMKTIRLENNGNLKESMVFDVINYKQLAEETIWEESTLYKTLTKRFFFIVFRKSTDQQVDSASLEKAFFWSMPASDLAIAKAVWTDTREKILKDDFSHFVRISDKKICHVRPKAVNAHDLTISPSGLPAPKKAFWLNRQYILQIIANDK